MNSNPAPRPAALAGRGLRLAQAAWLGLAFFYAATFLLALPGLLQRPVELPSWPAWTVAETRLALNQLGWSAPGVAAIQIARLFQPVWYAQVAFVAAVPMFVNPFYLPALSLLPYLQPGST